MTKYNVFVIILIGVLWASYVCSLVSEINLGEMLSNCFFKYFFCSFPSFISIWYTHYMYVTPQSLDITFSFIQSFFAFWFSRILLMSSGSECLSSALSSLLIISSKGFFISVTDFFFFLSLAFLLVHS